MTLAALALPGMAFGAEPTYLGFQYSRYEEGGRQYWPGPAGTLQALPPLQVQSISAGVGLKLSDRTSLGFGFTQDTWSGATPILSAPEAFLTVSGASAYPASDGRTNRQLVPYGIGPGGIRIPQPTPYNVMTSASPETRRQGEISLHREWNEGGLDLGAGVSYEPDFNSRFVSTNVRWDFDQKLTSLNAGLSYTGSTVDANLGAPTDWIDYGQYLNAPSGPTITKVVEGGSTVQRFTGTRDSWGANVGVNRVLDKNTTLALSLGYSRDSGFLENPYKLVLVAFADPATPPALFNGLLLARIFNIAESRPDYRNQWTVSTRFAHYFDTVDAALRLRYAFGRDDWGIRSHTLEAAWSQAAGPSWLVTPRLRYYSQNAADFYQPYFIFGQRAPTTGAGTLDFARFPIQDYSSDQRLSAFGAVSAGLTVSHAFDRGVTLEAGIERYVHAGSLKLGGGGTEDFADFDYWMFNVGLRINLDGAPVRNAGLAMPDTTAHADHQVASDSAAHAHHSGMRAPAGVMYAHMMDQPDDWMVGYRSMLARQSGSVMNGRAVATDAQIAANGCLPEQCTVAPDTMAMSMHMLDVMYAPTSWLNLMLMFQYMGMDMTMRPLEGQVLGGGGVHDHGAHASHTTGGVGDTLTGAMVKLFDRPGHWIHAGLALSIPTGAVDLKMSNGEFLDYGMQLGSGTWDLVPSLTYNGSATRWFWGAQISGTTRTGGMNASGYALGDVLSASAWAGRDLTPGIAATIRGVSTIQGSIRGHYNGPAMMTGPMDSPVNYGGHFNDIGLGLSFAVPGRQAWGDRIAVEWLKPVGDEPNGYQLARKDTLWFSWITMF